MIGRFVVGLPAGTGHGGSSPSWWTYLFGALLVVVGLVFMAKPKLQWQLNRWQYKHPEATEPSAKGLVAARVSAAGMIAGGVVFIVIAATH